MKFAFIPHPITKDGDTETITLEVGRYGDQTKTIKVVWTRIKGTDWSNARVLGVSALHQVLAVAGSNMRTLAKFVEDHELDMDDPDALISMIEREGGSCYVRNAAGQLVCYSDVSKNGDRKEFITTTAAGMNHEYSVFAEDEDRAKAMVTRLLVSGAEDNDALYDELKHWGKAGKPIKEVEKKSTVKAPDLGLYCKRGHQRKALAMKLKLKEKVKEGGDAKPTK